MTTEFKSGFIAVIGRPNVGKSTLINHFVGQKVVIMSEKPQTTRNKISCVLTLPDAQLIFIDTPGIHKPQNKLGEFMVQTAQSTLKDVEVILFVVDAVAGFGSGDEYILSGLKDVNTPVILVINKIDQLKREKVLPIITQYAKLYPFAAVVPISALQNTNVEQLVAEIKKRLSAGPKYYPDDMVTDQPERLIIAEMIREKALGLTRDEVPHSLAVAIEEITTRPNEDLFIRAVIYVERESQKGIVIGAKGSMLKEIGKQARRDIEGLLGSKVFLDLWVKVKKDWRNQTSSLKMFGYE